MGFSGSTVDLGTVVCLEDDSPGPDIQGFGDSVTPSSGQVFFYLYRGTEGSEVGPGSYGLSSSGLERVTGVGGCGN